MKVEAVRIENFQCVRDSGIIAFDDHITVLVGQNESGKSAIFKALSHFNRGEVFEDVDVSTLSSIRRQLDSGTLSRENVEMVAIWFALEDQEKRQLALPRRLEEMPRLKIVKMLDNSYHVLTADGAPLSKVLINETIGGLITYLEDVQAKVRSIYCGRVKSKMSPDSSVFLERHKGEGKKDNLLLHSRYAKGIWNKIRAGDWLQVTKIAPDPLGNNPIALNAGLYFDLDVLLSKLIEAIKKQPKKAQTAFKKFKRGLNQLPEDHPLRDYIGSEALARLEALCDISPDSISTRGVSLLESKIISRIPEFVYLPRLEGVADSVSVHKLTTRELTESERLLRTLVRVSGLRPEATVKKEAVDRMKTLQEKSEILTEYVRKSCFLSDISIDLNLLNEDRDIGIAISSAGSYDPPSRRSHGFEWYLALFAKLTELAERRNIVVLLDDPAVHLHPIAQEKILPFLESQPFQIVLATHLPFMVNPEHLERIRVVKRTLTGSEVEQDWAKAQETLKGVWGALLTHYTGEVFLLVEGTNDRECYSVLSEACARAGKQHLRADVTIVPGGGNQLPDLAQALHSRGIFLLIVVDGDTAGQNIKKRALKLCPIDETRIIALNEIFPEQQNPTLTHLLSLEFRNRKTVREQGLFQVIASKQRGAKTFDDETLKRFEKVFASVNAVIAQRSARNVA